MYFIPATRATAQAFRDRLAAELPGVQVSTLATVRSAPAPSRGSKIQIPNGELEAALRWLMLEHGDHSVLIHHSRETRWKTTATFRCGFGPALPLDFRGL